MAPARVVLDASAFMRAVEGHGEATEWVARIESRDVRARAPDLIYAEVANALLVQCRAARVGIEAAGGLLDVLRRLPIRVTSLRELAVPALGVAHDARLTAYDAAYVTLAERARATLLTADRWVARAAAGSVLLD
jgi:predicted nucleic acid-binding protein